MFWNSVIGTSCVMVPSVTTTMPVLCRICLMVKVSLLQMSKSRVFFLAIKGVPATRVTSCELGSKLRAGSIKGTSLGLLDFFFK